MFTTRSRRAVLATAAMAGAALLALTGCAGGGAGGEAAHDPDEEVTLNFTWWGNDDRATRYQELIAAVRTQPGGTWLPLKLQRGEELIEMVVRFPVER